MSPLYDAHNHLQDPRLAPHLDRILPALRSAGVARCVVNGTSAADWPRVAELAHREPHLIQPSFGLHPWQVPSRRKDWLAVLKEHLAAFPHPALGECGLDRWIENHDLDDQRDVFLAHLELATGRNLPLSIHCLRAWGPLLDCLRKHPLPERGFLLHSYGGSTELVPELVELGAYFSFSGAFLDPRKSKVREAFRAVPLERILIETDAPDMLPPPEGRPLDLLDPDGRPLNHPANLPAIADGLAADLQLSPATLRQRVEGNYHAFFGRQEP